MLIHSVSNLEIILASNLKIEIWSSSDQKSKTNSTDWDNLHKSHVSTDIIKYLTLSLHNKPKNPLLFTEYSYWLPHYNSPRVG